MSEISRYFAYKSNEKVKKQTSMHPSANVAFNKVLQWEATLQISRSARQLLILTR